MGTTHPASALVLIYAEPGIAQAVWAKTLTALVIDGPKAHMAPLWPALPEQQLRLCRQPARE
ncbi:MAG: hypothetical protein AAGL89_18530, partial [Pseudomonadota bacterium]